VTVFPVRAYRLKGGDEWEIVTDKENGGVFEIANPGVGKDTTYALIRTFKVDDSGQEVPGTDSMYGELVIAKRNKLYYGKAAEDLTWRSLPPSARWRKKTQ
jgi:hypothetical protein